MSRQETFVDLNGGPSRKVSSSVLGRQTTEPPTILSLEKPLPSARDGSQSLNSATTLVDMDSILSLTAVPVVRPDSRNLCAPARLERNETLVSAPSALLLDFGSREGSADVLNLVDDGPMRDKEEQPLSNSEESDMAISTNMHTQSFHEESDNRSPVTSVANGTAVGRRSAAEVAASLARSIQEQAAVAAATAPPVHPIITTTLVETPINYSPATGDSTVLKQQAHQSLAEILNRWHLQRLTCIQGIHAFVMQHPDVAYEVFQHDEARNVLKIFEWDLDFGVQQMVSSINAVFAGYSTRHLTTVQGDAAPLLQLLQLCTAEKLSFVRQLVAFTTAGEHHHFAALKESPTGYYLLPLLYDSVVGIPEVSCKILLQAGKFNDENGQALGVDISPALQQHWMTKLRAEMWEERKKVSERQQHTFGAQPLGLGVDGLHPEGALGIAHQQGGLGTAMGNLSRATSLLSLHGQGLGSPPSIFVDPKILFPDGSDNEDLHDNGRQPFRVFRTPHATAPSTPLLGLPFPSVGRETYKGYLRPTTYVSSAFSDSVASPSLGYEPDLDGDDRMQWESYEAPPHFPSPAPQRERELERERSDAPNPVHGQQQPRHQLPQSSPQVPVASMEPIIVGNTQRKTMNSLSTATILRFAIPPAFETAVSLANSTRRDVKPGGVVKKKKPPRVMVEGGPSQPLTKPSASSHIAALALATAAGPYRTGEAVQRASPGAAGAASYTIEEFSEDESSAGEDLDRSGDRRQDRGHDRDRDSEGTDSELEEPGSPYRSGSGVDRNRPKKRTKKLVSMLERPRLPKPAPTSKPAGGPTAKAPKKCEWCFTNHSPEWRKGPTGEKTWVLTAWVAEFGLRR